MSGGDPDCTPGCGLLIAVFVNLCFAMLRSVVELKDVEEIKLRLLEAEAESQDSDENQLKKVCVGGQRSAGVCACLSQRGISPQWSTPASVGCGACCAHSRYYVLRCCARSPHSRYYSASNWCTVVQRTLSHDCTGIMRDRPLCFRQSP